MPYCLYVRKSRADAEAEQRGEGETLTRHINTLLELSKRRQLTVTQIYKEIVSGETIAARPVMQQLLTEVEQGIWDGVLVMEVERLARGDTVDQGIVAQTFKYSGTKIITPMKDYDPNNEFDEEYFEFGLFMSRREYKTINRRLQAGRAASVKEGKFVGNKAPYGYKRVKLEGEKGFSLEIVPEEAEAVRLIFHLYAVGEAQPDGDSKRLGTALIARKLNALHYPTRTGGVWTSTTIGGILRNPCYIGKVRWNHRKNVKHMEQGQVMISRPRSKEYLLADGLHEPILSEETFQAVQELMAKNPPRPTGLGDKTMNPLSGLVVCGLCGRKMQRRPYGTRRAMDTLMCVEPQCPCVSSDLWMVEERLLQVLAGWLEEYRGKVGQEAEIRQAETEQFAQIIQRLETEQEKCKKQLDAVYDFLERGIYTTEQFLERSERLGKKLSVIGQDLTAMRESVAQEQKRIAQTLGLMPKLEQVLQVYHKLPDGEARNKVLLEVVEKAVYTKTAGRRQGASPDNFQLIAYPNLPT